MRSRPGHRRASQGEAQNRRRRFENRPRHPARKPNREAAAHGDLSPDRESHQPGKGQSAVAAAAYRSGERLRDEQANEQKFYQARAERIEFTAIMAPKDAPDWAQDRNQLWNHAERAEKRKDAQLAREIEIALPHELTPQQREWLVKDFAREAFTRKGYAVDIAIHAPDKTSDDRNHHAHIMVTMRTLDGDGFAAKKDPAMNRREQLGEWREQWAHLANRHLERHGHEARIDHRSLKEQGIEREAGIHLGYAANEMAQRGAQSDRMDALQQVIARNDIRTLRWGSSTASWRGWRGSEVATKILADREAARQSGLTSSYAKASEDGKAPPDMPAPKARGVKSDELAAGMDERAERRETKFWQDQKAWRASMREQTPKTMKPAEKGFEVADRATGAVTSLADFVSDLLMGSSAKPEPEKKADMGAYVSDPAARKERQLARAAAARAESDSEKAIESIRKDMETGRRLKPEDVQHLTREHQEQIRSKGDDYVRQMVDDAREKLERSSRGEGRERD